MGNLLSVATVDNNFGVAPDLKGSPVENEEVIENIKQSAFIDSPVFKKRKEREGSFIFVAGGPTLRNFIGELKRRSRANYICTSNKTYDYLVEQGITPSGCLVIDPKECVKDYITKPQKETEFFIGVVCNPQVIKGLLEKGMRTYRLLVGYGIEDESDLKMQRIIYEKYSTYLCGGTMTGLRAMNFSSLMGYSKIEYYGFDSCFSSENVRYVMEDEPDYEKIKKENKGISYIDSETNKTYTLDERDGGFFYAYKKKRGENIQVGMTPDGRRFLTSPCFAHQANQAMKWIERLEGRTEVIIHGDSLTAHLHECLKKVRKKEFDNIGDRRWTPEYAVLQKNLHKNQEYGIHGDHDVELVSRAILALYHSLGRKIKMLDYGCGKGQLAKALTDTFNIVEARLYDPFIKEISREPDANFDVVTCFDVMEHVEPCCVENTLKYIANKAKFMVVFSIAFDDAEKELSDGRNAHITQKKAQWWLNKLSKYFIVVESAVCPLVGYFACQALEADMFLKEEKHRGTDE